MKRGMHSGHANAVKIKAILDTHILPITVSHMVTLLVQAYGRTRKYWFTILGDHFNSSAYEYSILTQYTRRKVDGRFSILRRMGKELPVKSKGEGHKPNTKEVLNALMWQERVSWQKVHPSNIYAKEGDLDVIEHFRICGDLGCSSNWSLIEQHAWLFSNSIKRPRDAYGRHGKRVKGSRFSAIN